MTAPIFMISSAIFSCIPDLPDRKKKDENITSKLTYIAIAFDTIASIATLVVGILGATAVIGMSAAAAYTLIGISGGITAIWITFIAAIALTVKCAEQSKAKLQVAKSIEGLHPAPTGMQD